MDALRTTGIVVLGSVLAAGTVMGRSGTLLAATFPATAAPAQFHPDPPVIVPPPPSAAEVVAAARRARISKEVKESGKREAVWNDDNIPRIPRDITVVGHAETDAGSAPAAADGSAAAPATSPAPKTPLAASPDKKEELTRAREHAADVEKDLELAQRQFELDQNQISQNPDYANDHAGQAKLKSGADQLQAKRQQLDDLKKQISTIEAQTKP
jgi:hypothetical protein